MKQLILARVAVMAIAAAGCASYQGGAEESYSSSVGGAESHPEPMGSPAFRPGMNSQNPRDLHFTRPFATAGPPVQPPPSLTF